MRSVTVKPYDPTKDEMLQTLNYIYEDYEGSLSKDEIEFDIESATYWFSNDYHSGQRSNLYSALSTSQYRPGRLETSESCRNESEICSELYDALVNKYIINDDY